MNILSNDQMKSREKKLLELYQHSDLKLRVNMEELIEMSTSKTGMRFFKKPERSMKSWVNKLVPLTKKLQSISLREEENALFKVISYIFLLIIYKSKDKQNDYVRDQIKCSLYSDDVDLLEIKNHSFNKKMHSDKIKAVIAHTFKQIEYLSGTNLLKQHNIKAQDILLYLMSKNDIVSEGFHLFYRVILSKLQVQNAQNCIQDVHPEQAISNLVEYFDIDCRILDEIYLFNDDGVFISEFADELLVFGKYYQNQMDYQESSNEDEEDQAEQPPNQAIDMNIKIPRTLLKEEEIANQDVRNFNFLLDTDRNDDDSEMSSRPSVADKVHEGQTPCFASNEQYKFGKKKQGETDREKDLQSSLNKIKDRLQNERINEIQSQEEDNAIPTNFDIDSPQIMAGNPSLNFEPSVPNNRFLNLGQDSQNGSDFDEDNNDDAPTPMLGGMDNFHFGQKQPTQRDSHRVSPLPANQETLTQNSQSIHYTLSKMVPFQTTRLAQLAEQNKGVRDSAIRRRTVQQGSSKSKSSQPKRLQMKKSKNQIQVIDQTASRTSLYQGNYNPNRKLKTEEIEQNEKKQNSEKFSSLSSCTCHVIKQNRIKIESQIIEVIYESPRRMNTDAELGKVVDKNFTKRPNQIVIPQIKKYDFKTESSVRNALKNQTCESPAQKSPVDSKLKDKRVQFLNFLKKDKKDLIKKLSDKRSSKVNATTTHAVSNQRNFGKARNLEITNKTVTKQSMFVGMSPSNNTFNPENRLGVEDTRTKNKTISPSHSVQKVDNRPSNSRQQSGSKQYSRVEYASSNSVSISYGVSQQNDRGAVGGSFHSHNNLNPGQVQMGNFQRPLPMENHYNNNSVSAHVNGQPIYRDASRGKAVSNFMTGMPPPPTTIRGQYSQQQQPITHYRDYR